MNMIAPGGIPRFTGELEQLDKDISALRGDAIGIRDGGADVHSRFQMLGAYYKAPEAHDLFASTEPVLHKSDDFAADLETVADALETYAVEVRPLAKRLETLRAEAITFVDSVEGDDDWTYDGDKVDRNNELRDSVSETVSAFKAAERRAATKISAIVHGPKFVVDDGSGRKPTKDIIPYGYDSDLLKEAKDLPWGSAVSESIHVYEVHRHFKHYVWDGFVVDGAGGALKGLGHLVGIGGSAKDAWSKLGTALGGLGQYAAKPFDLLWDQTLMRDVDSEGVKRQKSAARDFAKGVVAWDQWKDNPVRAAGTATFNVLTLGAGPMGVVAKGGSAAAKAAGVGAKAGTYADPLSAAIAVGGKGISKMPDIPKLASLPKVSDLTSRIRGGSDVGVNIDAPPVYSVMELDDGSKVVVKDGEFTVSEKGVDKTGTVPHEPSAAARAAAPEPVRRHELVGAEARAQDGPAPHASAHHDASIGHGEAGSARSQRHDQSGGDVGARNPGAAGAADSGASTADSGSGHGPGPRGGSGSGTGDLPGRGPGGPHPAGAGWYDDLSPQQIKDVQVYRANHEPGYFEKYYQIHGRRNRLHITDESGFTPPHLKKDPNNPHSWIAASDKPSPFPEKYLPGSRVDRGTGTVRTEEDLTKIQDSARQRYASVQADNAWHDPVREAKEAYEAKRTDANLRAHEDIKARHAPFHERMSKDSEAFGEAVSRYHVIPEHYQGYQWEELSGPKNGNDQFDQLWSHTDGNGTRKFVVIESKGSHKLGLGKRELPNGFDARQGSKEYFVDILRKMRERGLDGDARELSLYRELKKALRHGNVDYVLVKAKSTAAGEYAGYSKWTFDIR
ncbi:hypothetical protein GPA10_01215 [Streptomyces sp. p1417]|uniref:Uncharacterized protein n=1 Tax=Streptomyces typhae TaxID=2681492 RepID=A0A6L6WNX8_9ACTN|nr:hypothetical protein [Streptomyces typhae]MVO83409.1 hypothetical protein [Streptomyces typhae]